jgi:large subunit ribosomal protein L13
VNNLQLIDGTNLIYGRLSSYVAKQLLNGEEIVIVNANKVAITGSKDNIFKKFEALRDIGSVRKGPYYPRTSNQILRRTIGDMLPKTKTRGAEALKRCKVYSGFPEDLKKLEPKSLEEVKNNKSTGYLTLGEISKHLGGKY